MPEEEQGQEGQEGQEGSQQPSMTIDEFIAQNYPLPGSKDKPLKINATELDAIILIPKGVKAEPPAAQQQKPASAPAASSPPKPQASEKPFEETRLGEELSKKLSAAKTKVDELEQKLTSIDADRKDTLISAIVDERLSKRYILDADVEKVKENLSSLEAEHLKALLEDTKALPDLKAGKPQPKSSKQQLSEEEVKREELREQLFGHKKPVEVWLSEQNQQGGAK